MTDTDENAGILRDLERRVGAFASANKEREANISSLSIASFSSLSSGRTLARRVRKLEAFWSGSRNVRACDRYPGFSAILCEVFGIARGGVGDLLAGRRRLSVPAARRCIAFLKSKVITIQTLIADLERYTNEYEKITKQPRGFMAVRDRGRGVGEDGRGREAWHPRFKKPKLPKS